MKVYTFNYFTGYGYIEISSHTIEVYPITIKAKTFQEAAQKCKKKARSLSRYNKCFSSEQVIQVIEKENKESKTGIYWIEDEIIKWEGEVCYWRPPVFGNTHMQSFNLPNAESYYGTWIKDFCTGRVTYSYVGWMKYSIQRFDYTKFWSTASKEEQERDYKKYVVDEIDYLLKSNHCPKEDKEELKKLKLIEN